MIVRRVELADFRNYRAASFVLDAGLTAVVGDNGQGKTNLAEALAYLATLQSFRGVPAEALIRIGADQAVVRAEVEHDDGRVVTIEAEISRNGRHRTLVNKQRLQRGRDLLGVIRVTVFAPDDLAMIKEGPGERRRYLDELLVSLHPKNDALRSDLDRILRQRNVLLKQAGGRLTDETAFTLDVWDAKLAETGEAMGRARAALVERLAPMVELAYAELAAPGVPAPEGTSAPDGTTPDGTSTPDATTAAAAPTTTAMVYDPPWRRSGLADALVTGRADDVRRQISMTGPHRDELDLAIGGMPARTHASQGEQRTLALAMRLAGHRLVTERTGSPPVLVLDDVLSELDPTRAAALLHHVPPGQVVLTTAGVLPPSAAAARVVRIAGGTVVA